MLDSLVFENFDKVCPKLADVWAETTPIMKSKGFEHDRTLLNYHLCDKLKELGENGLAIARELNTIRIESNYVKFLEEIVLPKMVANKALLFNI